MKTPVELAVPDQSLDALVQCIAGTHDNIHGTECARAIGAPIAAEELRAFVTALIADDRVPRDVIAAGFARANHLDTIGGPE